MCLQILRTLEPADNRLVELTTQKDYDVSALFRSEDNQNVCKSPQPERERQRTERMETETFYLTVSDPLCSCSMLFEVIVNVIHKVKKVKVTRTRYKRWVQSRSRSMAVT